MLSTDNDYSIPLHARVICLFLTAITFCFLFHYGLIFEGFFICLFYTNDVSLITLVLMTSLSTLMLLSSIFVCEVTFCFRFWFRFLIGLSEENTSPFRSFACIMDIANLMDHNS